MGSPDAYVGSAPHVAQRPPARDGAWHRPSRQHPEGRCEPHGGTRAGSEGAGTASPWRRPHRARDAARDAARAAEDACTADESRERWTLASSARDYHERAIEPNRTTKHAAQWISSLENQVPAALWHAPVDAIKLPGLAGGAAGGLTPRAREASARRDRGGFRVLPYEEVPALKAALRAAEGVSARCPEFRVLTAARTS